MAEGDTVLLLSSACKSKRVELCLPLIKHHTVKTHDRVGGIAPFIHNLGISWT